MLRGQGRVRRGGGDDLVAGSKQVGLDQVVVAPLVGGARSVAIEVLLAIGAGRPPGGVGGDRVVEARVGLVGVGRADGDHPRIVGRRENPTVDLVPGAVLAHVAGGDDYREARIDELLDGHAEGIGLEGLRRSRTHGEVDDPHPIGRTIVQQPGQGLEEIVQSPGAVVTEHAQIEQACAGRDTGQRPAASEGESTVAGHDAGDMGSVAVAIGARAESGEVDRIDDATAARIVRREEVRVGGDTGVDHRHGHTLALVGRLVFRLAGEIEVQTTDRRAQVTVGVDLEGAGSREEIPVGNRRRNIGHARSGEHSQLAIRGGEVDARIVEHLDRAPGIDLHQGHAEARVVLADLHAEPSGEILGRLTLGVTHHHVNPALSRRARHQVREPVPPPRCRCSSRSQARSRAIGHGGRESFGNLLFQIPRCLVVLVLVAFVLHALEDRCSWGERSGGIR